MTDTRRSRRWVTPTIYYLALANGAIVTYEVLDGWHLALRYLVAVVVGVFVAVLARGAVELVSGVRRARRSAGHAPVR